MRIPLVGGTYQMESVSFDNQRCVNMYLVGSETGTSKSFAGLRPVAGYTEFVTIGGGAIRGGIESSNRAFFISGDEFYEVYSDGTSTDRGTLLTLSGQCQLAENPTQVMIVDGTYGYTFNKTTNTFAQITDVDFPTPSSLTFQDGYFIVSEADSSKFYISSLNDGDTWATLDFTTVEASPDDLVAVRSNRSNLWCFGTKVTEVFQNTGNANFPFQRLSGAFIQTGCAAADTIVNIDNSLFWVGADENGEHIVWRTNGYNAQRISTQAIERKIADTTNISQSYGWSYHERGHAFYVLQIKGLMTTLVFDLSTGQWHERIYRDPDDGSEQQYRGSCHIFAFNKHLIGDRLSGKVYEQNLNYHDFDGEPRICKRITPWVSEEKRMIPHARIELDCEVGQGLNSGQGSDPIMMMRYSDDGYRWSSELQRGLGKLGEYKTRVIWNKLGRSRSRIYEFSYSDPIFCQINDCYLNAT